MIIDLRSDTVTQPCEKMRQAMSMAKVGDDVYEDDPTVNLLQEKAATLSGKEAALFMPTGTQSNLVAILAHCQRGDSFIVGEHAHIYQYEAGGSAVLGGTLPKPIIENEDGTLPLEKVLASIKPKDIHFAPTTLLCLENTFNGKVIDLGYQETVCQTVRKKHGLKVHLDGARLFNASIATNTELKKLTAPYDSVSLCLSKGLGAPVGSVLCGNTDFISRAKAWRKMLGGGMRQSGVLAAAGLFCLEHNINRLKEDHDRASTLAECLINLGWQVKDNQAQTNMIFINDSEQTLIKLNETMKSNKILLSYGGAGNSLRIVLHKDITDEGLNTVINAFNTYQRN
ncbi:low-specificity L-threonine aldolase [Thorsellia anophelis]|uniref:L-threonine aldolase n=1 Tax=Thorsellia anophelis DSM 18579 TaxID=1123402 RepID=A0A1I0B259_9GAMM|nr:low-specificity L-threonine aldolase [Thorsellia anophelis]SET00928.1 L-threonine aldolase [Thorsellia anophelis DSM 18579]